MKEVRMKSSPMPKLDRMTSRDTPANRMAAVTFSAPNWHQRDTVGLCREPKQATTASAPSSSFRSSSCASGLAMSILRVRHVDVVCADVLWIRGHIAASQIGGDWLPVDALIGKCDSPDLYPSLLRIRHGKLPNIAHPSAGCVQDRQLCHCLRCCHLTNGERGRQSENPPPSYCAPNAGPATLAPRVQAESPGGVGSGAPRSCGVPGMP
eukprot:scaffold12239_cov111-Isochrysis_galbana.AAC.2